MYIRFGQSPKREEGKKETNWAPNLAIIRRKLEGQETKPFYTWGLVSVVSKGSSKYVELFPSLLFSSRPTFKICDESTLRKDWIRRGKKIKKVNFDSWIPLFVFWFVLFLNSAKSGRFIVASFELRRGGEGEGLFAFVHKLRS